MVVRRVLRIRERPAGVTAASAYTAFQRSMLISAIRCTLTYVVFPFVVPAIGGDLQRSLAVLPHRRRIHASRISGIEERWWMERAQSCAAGGVHALLARNG
jgi:hypothetical protein